MRINLHRMLNSQKGSKRSSDRCHLCECSRRTLKRPGVTLMRLQLKAEFPPVAEMQRGEEMHWGSYWFCGVTRMACH